MTEYDVRQMKQVALVQALTANLVGTIAGMVAENMVRQHQGEGPAYVEDSFQLAIRDSGIWGFNAVMDMLNV